ncbi:MAG TPA: hypothetical protein VGN17_14560 [Bryobacteraceae bacterium]|jgi:hypothetical protein
MQRFKTSLRQLRLRKKLFDAAFYLTRYPDVAAARMNPVLHYLQHGASEGRKPNPWFDPDYYLAQSPQARRRGGEPFTDFLEYGRREGASPHPLGRSSDAPAQEGSQFGCDS